MAAQASYRRNTPHYPLSVNGPIYQAFSVGRVRVVMLDIRSEQVRKGDAHPENQIISETQMQWLFAELATAPTYAAMVIVSSASWIGAEVKGKESWLGHVRDRERVANFIASNNLDNVAIIAGDAHMLAIDDGTNGDYSTVPGSAGIPVMQAAPLANTGSNKGGPYSAGCVAYKLNFNQHYGTMQVSSVSGVVSVTWRGHRVGIKEPVLTYTAVAPFVKAGIKEKLQVGCRVPLFHTWMTVLIVVLASLLIVNTLLPLKLRNVTDTPRGKALTLAAVWVVPLISLLVVLGDVKYRSLILDDIALICIVLEGSLLLSLVAIDCSLRKAVLVEQRHDVAEHYGSVITRNAQTPVSEAARRSVVHC